MLCSRTQRHHRSALRVRRSAMGAALTMGLVAVLMSSECSRALALRSPGEHQMQQRRAYIAAGKSTELPALRSQGGRGLQQHQQGEATPFKLAFSLDTDATRSAGDVAYLEQRLLPATQSFLRRSIRVCACCYKQRGCMHLCRTRPFRAQALPTACRSGTALVQSTWPTQQT